MGDNLAKEAGEPTDSEKKKTKKDGEDIVEDKGTLIDATKPWSKGQVQDMLDWSARTLAAKKKASQSIGLCVKARLWDDKRAHAAIHGSPEAKIAAVIDGLWTQFKQSNMAMTMEDMRKFIRYESIRAELYPEDSTLEDMYRDPDPKHIASLGDKYDDIHRRMMEALDG